jgi:hypothetical protein
MVPCAEGAEPLGDGGRWGPIAIGLFDAISIALELVMIMNLLSIAAHFAGSAKARVSAERFFNGYKNFRWGMSFILVGIAIIAEADAVRYTAGLSLDDPSFSSIVIVGQVMVVAGMSMINGIILSSKYDKAPPELRSAA